MTEAFGNPASVDHRYGEEAAALVEAARAQVADLIGADVEDVQFTTGSTEGIRLALAYAAERAGPGPLRVAVSRGEHDAVLEAVAVAVDEGWASCTWMEVDGLGRVSASEIERALGEGAKLLCLMAANNEVGTIQDLASAAGQAHGAGASLLVDATQAAGRLKISALDHSLDYVVISGHKLYGPKGVGALVSPGLAQAPPPARYRGHAPTANVPAIAGLGEACRLRRVEMAVDEARIRTLRDELQARLLAKVPGLAINGDVAARLSNNLHVSAPGASNDLVVRYLRDTVAISTGAACSSGADAPSHVLRAMRLPAWRQDGALRISLGRSTTTADIERAAAAIAAAIRLAQAASQEAQ